LTGPAGTGKTSTIRVLAREMGFEILEWRNAIGDAYSTPTHLYLFLHILTRSIGDSSSLPSTSTEFHPEFDQNYEAIFTKFEAFLTRASTCQNIFPHIDSQISQSKTTKSSPRRHVILLEDLPNILHARTQAQFHEALNSLVASAPANSAVPLVIIISDAGVRGEVSDERVSASSERNKIQVVDVRTVLSKDLLGGPYVTEIGYLFFIYYIKLLFNNMQI
jgi:cell cycle checkpoint protein